VPSTAGPPGGDELSVWQAVRDRAVVVGFSLSASVAVTVPLASVLGRHG
jgi:hypothetical protein